MKYMLVIKLSNRLYIHFIWILCGLFILTGCGSNVYKNREINDTNVSKNRSQTPKVKISDTIFEVEVAITDIQRSRGLSDRDILENNNGMVFVFNKDSATQFWMYGMKFPLDLIWISSSCEVVDITYNAEQPEHPTSSQNLVLYSSKLPATYTLEINAGEANLHSINIGEEVKFFNFPKEYSANCE